MSAAILRIQRLSAAERRQQTVYDSAISGEILRPLDSFEPLEHSIEVANPWGWRSPMVAVDETGGTTECDEPR